MSITTTYAVDGMTCGHCVAAVTSEVSRLPGVDDVSVDLDRGQVTVVSSEPVPSDRVREAVDEAGYEVTGVIA